MAEEWSLRPCPECGKRIPQDAKACPYCGVSYLQPASHSPQLTVGAFQHGVPPQPVVSAGARASSCGRCGYQDVEKISGIAARGTWDGQTVEHHWQQGHLFPTGHSYGVSSSQTRLAQLLSPPRQPRPIPNGVLVGACCLWCFTAFLLVSALASMVPYWGQLGEWFPELTAMLVFCTIASAIGAYWMSRQASRERLRIASILEEQTLYGQKQLALWDRCYYCPRCDEVFDPLSGNRASPAIASTWFRV